MVGPKLKTESTGFQSEIVTLEGVKCVGGGGR